MVGSSFIGMEIVITVLKRKLASIDVIGRGHVPFEPVLGKDVGIAIQKVESTVRFLVTRSPLLVCVVPRISGGEIPLG